MTRRRTAAVVLVATGAFLSPSFAGDLTGYLELSYSDSAFTFQPPAGLSVDQNGSAFTRRANATWTRRLFPNLLMQIGGFYERTDGTLADSGFSRDVATTRFRPFARLALRSQYVIGELSWYRNEDTLRTEGFATFDLTRDVFLGVAGWYPADLPSLRAELSRTEDRDATKTLVDVTQDVFRLTSDYTPVPSTRLYYRGLLERDDDRIRSTEFTTMTHSGEARFGDRFFDDRWDVSANWNGAWRKVTVDSSGTGELLIPQFPVTGGFVIDDTPADGTLAPLPALVDGNTLVGTGINLGLPPPAGDSRPRNFGADLGLAVGVNVARVWVDRDLPPEISSSFSWEIWTSDDGTNWVPRATVATAPFGPFDPRFELRFPAVNSRYLKVVVRPLIPSVPSASSYPTILVTELELFLAQPSGSTSSTTTRTRNLLQANSRLRLLKDVGFYYETGLYVATTTGSPTTWTFSNGLSFQRQFTEVWSLFSRVTREDGEDQGGHRTAYVYTASVYANPLDTLRNSLTLSGTNEDRGGFATDSIGVFLNSDAAIYHGIDLNVSLGQSHNQVTNGASTDTTQYHVGWMFVPHPTLTVNLNFDDRDSTIHAAAVPDRPQVVRYEEIAVAYDPVPSIYLFGSRRFEQRTLEADRTIDAFAASWSPFPGGAFRLSLNYSENRDTFSDRVDRTFTPNLRWNVNGATYVEASYQDLTTDSTAGRTHQSILAATLHFGF